MQVEILKLASHSKGKLKNEVTTNSKSNKIRSTIDKMPVPELVLKNAGKHDEKPCHWILKNSGFAWEGLHFSDVQQLQDKIGVEGQLGIILAPVLAAWEIVVGYVGLRSREVKTGASWPNMGEVGPVLEGTGEAKMRLSLWRGCIFQIFNNCKLRWALRANLG